MSPEFLLPRLHSTAWALVQIPWSTRRIQQLSLEISLATPFQYHSRVSLLIIQNSGRPGGGTTHEPEIASQVS